LGIAPTTSTTLTLALGDALAIALMQKSNFAKEDFANFHPGGSLGRQLFIKVSDLMSCEDLPIINKDTKLSEAIHIMSQGRLGNVLIVDKDQKLLAVMSDGDLRRALMNKDFNLNHTALLYANANPKIIDNKSMLASEALIVVENYKIQLLIIVNQDKQVEGVLHLHQLIEAGIK
jgi:arabinose-5-phosphate isomerase